MLKKKGKSSGPKKDKKKKGTKSSKKKKSKQDKKDKKKEKKNNKEKKQKEADKPASSSLVKSLRASQKHGADARLTLHQAELEAAKVLSCCFAHCLMTSDRLPVLCCPRLRKRQERIQFSPFRR